MSETGPTEDPGGVSPPVDDPYRWVILVIATLTQAATAFVFLGVGALAGFIQEDFDLNGLQTGLLVTAIGLAPVVALLPTGRLLDIRSERVVITGGALVLGVGAGFASRGSSYVWILVLLLIAGTGYSASQPGGSKVVASWFPARQRGLAMGIRQTGLPLGGALAAAILPAIASNHDWRAAMLVGAVVAAVGGIAFGILYRRASSPVVTSPLRVGAELLGLLRARPVRLAMQSGLGMVSVQFTMISYLMLYLRDVHDIPLASGAWMLFTAQMAGVAGRVVLAAWSDRLSSRLIPVALAAGSAAVGTVALGVVPSDTAFVPLIVLSLALGFFAFGWYGPWVVFVAETAPAGAMGLTLALAMTANQVAIVIAPPIFGSLLDLSGGYTVPWLVMAAALAIVAARTAMSRPRGNSRTT